MKSIFSVQVADLIRSGMRVDEALREILGGIRDGSGPRVTDVLDDLQEMAVWQPKEIEPVLRKIADLRLGDMVDLEGDPYADPNHNSPIFDCEYACVCRIDVETPDCIAVGFEGIDIYGFPPGHTVTVGWHDKGYDEEPSP